MRHDLIEHLHNDEFTSAEGLFEISHPRINILECSSKIFKNLTNLLFFHPVMLQIWWLTFECLDFHDLKRFKLILLLKFFVESHFNGLLLLNYYDFQLIVVQ